MYEHRPIFIWNLLTLPNVIYLFYYSYDELASNVKLLLLDYNF